MMKWIGAAILAFTLTFGGSATIDRAAATALQKPQVSKSTDLSARRRAHNRHYAYRRYDRPYYPAYYDRPHYYAPAPFFPFLGLGYGPWW